MKTITLGRKELLERETRTLPSGTTFTRNRCKVCGCYWDTKHPRRKDEKERHNSGCSLLATMKKRGLAILSLIIVVACILIMGGILAIWLAHLAKRVLNPPPDNGGTNTTQQITITVPPLEFAPLPAPAGQTADNPMGTAYFVLERSTNLVNWEEVDTSTLPNPAIPMEFFRGKVVYPK